MRSRLALAPLCLFLAEAGAQAPEAAPPYHEAPLRAYLDRCELTPQLGDLVQALAKTFERDTGKDRLPQVTRLFASPLQGLPFAEDLTRRLHDDGRGRKDRAVLLHCAALLGLEGGKPGTAVRSLSELARELESIHDLAAAAFDKVPEQARPKLVAEAGRLLASFSKHIYVHEDAGHREFWEHSRLVDFGRLLHAQQRLLALASPEVVKALVDDARRREPFAASSEGVQGEVHFEASCRAGTIVVGARKSNRYSGPVAFVLDLGGDDVYGAAATRSSWGRHVNFACDLEGNDDYEAGNEPFAQGCGLFGVSLLVDRAGNDRYRAGRAAQGAGLCGIGMLIDEAGGDVYVGDAFVQGAGLLGIGICLDRAGADEMRAGLASMGFGWPRSVGLLLDGDGDDVRALGGKYPSAYGTKGEFNGLGHGASVGFRTLACGGFGIVVDGGGNDVTSVGEFGFGCGYYHGCGIVRDFGGDDRVEAARYGIATGAHFGLGFVIDDGGDDVWKNRSVASLAGNWDLTVSGFVDRAGDDVYETKALSLGCATITSFAAFFDLAGRDRYVQQGVRSFGRAGHPKDYDRKTVSIAVFQDLGGGEDHYPDWKWKTKLANGKEQGWALTHQPKKGGGEPRVVGRGVFLDR